MRRTWILLLLSCAWSAVAPAMARDSGIAHVTAVPDSVSTAKPPAVANAQVATSPTLAQVRLAMPAGGGWWRLDPAVSGPDRLLLVYHPYSARVSVRLPPDYRVQARTIFETDLDPAWSRRALAFPLKAPGPVFIGIDGARYPLQVAIRDVREHTAEDRGHTRVLFTSIGVLVGVCLVALVFWLVLRDRIYLWYAACMASQMLYLLCSNGEAYAMPGLRLLGRFAAPGVWFVATLSTIIGVNFLLVFAELRTRVPRLSRLLMLVGAWLPLLLLALLVSPWPANKDWFPGIGNLLLLLANIVAIAALALAWRRGGRHAGQMLLAWVPLVVMSTARAVQLSIGAPLSPWLEYGLPLVLACTAVVLMLGLADRMQAFRSERDRARQDAQHDPLSGAYNRVGIMQRLQHAVAEARAESRQLAVLFLDIDHFKQINDTHGHALGDACIRQLSWLVQEDLMPGESFGRLGGEEFMLVLPGVNGRHARDAAERLRRKVEGRSVVLDGVRVGMTVSIGSVEYVAPETPDALVKRADAAMYAAKEAGRNRVVAA
ncbi:diguanylate cyclase [Pseudoluteimonas lycopersici]|uniref:diguanylate cyclase n=1 Tax=Pseudoluteimonas lycopersici TaxID=1324796 RepID=A0A516V5Q8_9GAMM|nr:diguanylate cyclase [Lysobacter lycopersici]QDQ73856.1 diguanylate cyclase [Lysobacter lycopersici]